MTAVSSIPWTPAAAPPAQSARASFDVVNPTTRSDWDAVVARHPDATFFHGAAWAKTLAQAFGFEPCYLIERRDGDTPVVLPLMEARSWISGHRGVALPFTDECSPLLSHSGDARNLLGYSISLAEARRWRFLELRGLPDSLTEVSGSATYWNHVLSIEPQGDVMLSRAESAVQRAVRKGLRAGVTVEFRSDLNAVQAYYQMHCRTRIRKHGAPPQPFRFFQSIYENILRAGQGFVALARSNNQFIAGAVFFHFAGKAIYKFSASDDRLQELRGPNVIVSESLPHLARLGVKELNFGRTSLSNEGLRRFKVGWGSAESVVRYARYSVRAKRFISASALEQGIQARLVRRLPIFAARCLGRCAYPHLI